MSTKMFVTLFNRSSVLYVRIIILVFYQIKLRTAKTRLPIRRDMCDLLSYIFDMCIAYTHLSSCRAYIVSYRLHIYMWLMVCGSNKCFYFMFSYIPDSFRRRCNRTDTKGSRLFLFAI